MNQLSTHKIVRRMAKPGEIVTIPVLWGAARFWTVAGVTGAATGINTVANSTGTTAPISYAVLRLMAIVVRGNVSISGAPLLSKFEVRHVTVVGGIDLVFAPTQQLVRPYGILDGNLRAYIPCLRSNPLIRRTNQVQLALAIQHFSAKKKISSRISVSLVCKQVWDPQAGRE